MGCLEEHAAKEGEAGQELSGEDEGEDEASHQVLVESRESVHSIAADIAAIDEVEELAEDEAVPDEGEVDHLVLAEAKIVLVNRLSSSKVFQVEDLLAGKHDDHHDGCHEDGHAEDLTVHSGGQDLA